MALNREIDLLSMYTMYSCISQNFREIACARFLNKCNSSSRFRNLLFCTFLCTNTFLSTYIPHICWPLT